MWNEICYSWQSLISQENIFHALQEESTVQRSSHSVTKKTQVNRRHKGHGHGKKSSWYVGYMHKIIWSEKCWKMEISMNNFLLCKSNIYSKSCQFSLKHWAETQHPSKPTTMAWTHTYCIAGCQWSHSGWSWFLIFGMYSELWLCLAEAA